MRTQARENLIAAKKSQKYIMIKKINPFEVKIGDEVNLPVNKINSMRV